MYKRSNVSVAVQQYAVVRCDIDSQGGSLVLHSYTVIHISFVIYVKREGHGFALRK